MGEGVRKNGYICNNRCINNVFILQKTEASQFATVSGT